MTDRELWKWLGVDDLANRYDVPVRTIYSWRARNRGPKGYVFGRHLRFRSDDVERWEAEHADEARVG